MTYKHILVAVDLSTESPLLLKKAVSLARPYNAKISLIHVDVNYSDLYTGLIEANLGYTQEHAHKETFKALKGLSDLTDYPVSLVLSEKGDLAKVLANTIKKYRIDLIVCGHHQDFWSKLMSSARQLLSTVHTDMLIVPLREDDDD